MSGSDTRREGRANIRCTSGGSPGIVSCDNIVTIPTDSLGRQIGYLRSAQERDLSEAIRNAFDLDLVD